jgi:hypothetical protein
MSIAGCIDFLGVGLEITISSVDAADFFTVSVATAPFVGGATSASFGLTGSFFSSFGFSSSSGSASLVLLALINLVTLSSS